MVVHTAPGTTVPMRIVRNGKPQSMNIHDRGIEHG